MENKKMLDICRMYYEEYGKKMISEKFSSYESLIAVGLCGEGSECLGFDDVLSLDHDCGPGFAMWVTNEVYSEIGQELELAYNELPSEFMGYKRIETTFGTGRVGVCTIDDYYKRTLGGINIDWNNQIPWEALNDEMLATATSGQVFYDPLGEFSRRREALLAYYPEDIWREKLARNLLLSAQSGQYNYARLMIRGEVVAAKIALGDYLRSIMKVAFLINRKYSPYYKWQRRALAELSELSEIGVYLDEIGLLETNLEAWRDKKDLSLINYDDKTVLMIEGIARQIVIKLNEMGLSQSEENYLEAQGMEVLKKY